MSSPGQRVVPWPLPLSDILEDGAAVHMPVVHGGDPLGIEHPSAAAAGECGECHRRVGRTERGDAEVLRSGAQQLGRDARRDDAGRLALIVCGADGGVALDVLHRTHSRTHRADQVGDRGVALNVDELPRRAVRVGDVPQHDTGAGLADRVRFARNGADRCRET